ncbi:MAG: transcriptional repressor [Oleiphilus sp.]|nr:MAG: transcriptional repressor [Oleiphilus sp.]
MPEKTLTENRQAVLDVLSERHEAMSAYDILDSLHAGDRKWKPATVYRALNYLIESKLIHRIESEQKFICCGHSHKSHEQLFMICEICGQVAELSLEENLLAQFFTLAQAKQFALKSPYLEFRGLCDRCQKAESAGSE